MKKNINFTFSVIFVLSMVLSFSYCTKDKKEAEEEKKDIGTSELINLVNDYRESKGLARIPASASLNKVAQLHVKDLVENHPNQAPCNMHSWSDKGSWKPCCYTSDHKKASCMWSKPRELTSYKGDGYEIAARVGPHDITAKKALSLWKKSYGHNSVIINKGIWKQLEWQAIGAAMYKGYAVVWFGEKKDTE